MLDLQPARSTDTPAITRFETTKAELRHRGDEIIAKGLGGLQKRSIDDTADGMYAVVVRACLATASAVEASHGLAATDVERLAEDVLAAGFGFGGQRSRYKLKAIGSHGPGGTSGRIGFNCYSCYRNLY